MYRSQYPWVDLWKALHDYEGSDVYADLLEPWPDAHPGELAWLAEMAATSPWDPSETGNEDLCRLYSASRVTTILMLRLQQGRADESDWRGPAISLEGFQRFHEALGMRVPDATRFHPFFHEIVSVEQVEPAERPIELIRQVWPPLMLGDMMFSRGGCHVAGGSDHIVKDVAERSILYWAYRRKHRRCEDQSLGWGSNSQWRTALRKRPAKAISYALRPVRMVRPGGPPCRSPLVLRLRPPSPSIVVVRAISGPPRPGDCSSRSSAAVSRSPSSSAVMTSPATG